MNLGAVLDDQLLRTTLLVARTGSFAAAARETGVDPSSVSRQVAALEDATGIRVFDRTTRRLDITEAGRLYLERALPALEALDEAVELSADGLQIAISFNADEDGALLVSEVVALEVTETLSLPGDIRAAEDQRLWRARFPDEGAARFSAAQAAILELREADVQGTGSLSITVGQGCTGDRVPDTLSFRSWLRMDAGGAFIPFSRSDDLFALMDEAEAEALRTQLTASC